MRLRHMPALVVAAWAATQASTAHAHHVMDYGLPATAAQGLLSGLGHPIIGLDHFLFVLALGAVCYFLGRGVISIAAFLVMAAAGTLVHVQEVTLPYAEIWVAATLLVLGVALLKAPPVLKSLAGPILFALAGFVHGYAYGESIVGAERTPLIAYLVGFTVIQLVIALAGFAAARHADRKRHAQHALTAVGGVASAAGVVFLVAAMMG